MNSSAFQRGSLVGEWAGQGRPCSRSAVLTRYRSACSQRLGEHRELFAPLPMFDCARSPSAVRSGANALISFVFAGTRRCPATVAVSWRTAATRCGALPSGFFAPRAVLPSTPGR